MKKLISAVFLTLFGINVSSYRLLEDEIIYYGNKDINRIYLTFDDGYSVSNTSKILDILKEKDIHVTFFLEGYFLREQEQLVKRIINEGHFIGNHTWTHRDITKLSDQQFLEELELYEEKYFEITGNELLKIFRPPMGKIDLKKYTILKSYGYKVFMWNVTSIDYLRKKDRGVVYVYNEITKNTENGALILMHTLTDSVPNALPLIIDELTSKGFVFSSLSDFLVEL